MSFISKNEQLEEVGLGENDLTEKKITELLNCMGSKLLQLKGCLHKEANATKCDFDMSTYIPLIEKYRNEIGALDAFKMSRFMRKEVPENSLDSLSLSKHKYHYCLDELDKVSLSPCRSRTNGKMRRKENILELNLMPQQEDLFSECNDGNLTATRWPSHREIIGADTMEDFVDEDETDSKFKISPFMSTITSQMTQHDTNDGNSYNHNDMNSCCNRNLSSSVVEEVNKQTGRQFFKDPVAVENTNLFDGVSSSDGRESDVNIKDKKYKVVKKRLRPRTRVRNEHFYRSSSVFHSSFVSNNSASACFGISENSIVDEASKLDDQLLNESAKNANESWFDYKERLHYLKNRSLCSQECLIAQSETQTNYPDSRMGSASSIAIYGRHGQSSSNLSKSRKSVSFRLSPALSRRKEVEEINEGYISDSSVDEVTFDNEDFPRSNDKWYISGSIN